MDENALWFLVGDQKLLIRKDDDSYRVPESIDLEEVKLVPVRPLFLGRLDGIQCFASEFAGTGNIPEGFIVADSGIGTHDPHRSDPVGIAANNRSPECRGVNDGAKGIFGGSEDV